MIEINLADIIEIPLCSDCGRLIGYDDGPADGWELEDGRVVCQKCCVHDLELIINQIIKPKGETP